MVRILIITFIVAKLGIPGKVRSLLLFAVVLSSLLQMSSLQELTQTGKDLGYTGEALQNFVKEQQDMARAERQLERELAKAKLEEQAKQAQLDRDARQVEREEREQRLLKEREKQLEIEEREKQERRERDEREKQERKEREDREKQEKLLLEEKRLEVERIKLQNKLEMERLELELKYKTGVDLSASKVGTAKDPKLPYFEESKDKMDCYLARFERYATVNKWSEDRWAINLSALLKGRALEVFERLPAEDASDYVKLRDALLRNFDLTEEGFRKKFKGCRPEKNETFVQFISRSGSYLEKWLSLGKVTKTFEGLVDFLIRDQLLDTSNRELYLFLKQKSCESAKAMAKEADLFAEARGGASFVVNRDKRNIHQENKRNWEPKGNPQNQNTSGSRQSNGKFQLRCKHCAGEHWSYDCKKKGPSYKAAGISTEDKEDEKKDSQDEKSNGTRGGRRGRGSRGRGQRANNCTVSKTDGGEDKTEKVSNEGSTNQNQSDGTHKVGGCYFPQRLPTASGTVNGKPVVVLRDTGCTGIVVKRSLVNDDQLIGKNATCTLIDQNVQTNPLALVQIKCPFVTGEFEAMCMDSPMYDLTIGNVDGAKLPEMCHFQNEVVHAVETRAQVKRQAQNYRALKVPERVLEVTKEEFMEEQNKDPGLQQVRNWVKEGKTRKCRGSGTSKFIEHKGLLQREFETKDGKSYHQLVVPTKFRPTVLKIAHESLLAGHLGVRKTTERVLTEFYWPGVCSDVARFCRSCDICQRMISKGRVTKIPLGEHPLIDTPFKRVAVDIVGPIDPVTDRKNRYILTMVDYATRYPEAIALPSIEAERVAEALVDMFSRVGIPSEMLTDCGSQFLSNVMQEVSRLLSLRQMTTTPYHPICNGLVERFNGSLKQMLRKMCSERPRDWDKYLNPLLFAIREVPQESLRFAPFELLYGRSVRGPMNILRELWTGEEKDDEVKSTYQYVVDLRERLEETCKLAQKHLGKAKEVQKKYYDKKAKVREFKVGEQVLVLLPKNNNKLLLQWQGPFPVVEVVNKMDYRVNFNGKVRTFHANMLKAYISRTPEETANSFITVNAAVIDEGIDDEEPIQEMNFPSGDSTYQDVDINPELSPEEQESARQVLLDYSEVFSDMPGSTHLLKHDIKLINDEPFRVKGYAIPFHSKELVVQELDKMLSLGVVEPSNAPTSSPIVLIKKKDGSVRFCIDFRTINRISIFDAEPMPNMEEIFCKVSGYKFFSKLDCTKGYWQVPLTDKAKPLTAFETPRGLFQFKAMPFGLVNAGATYCRLMRMVLQDVRNVESFVDDIIVFSETWEDHVKTLREVIQRLREAGLTAKPSKCAIGYRSIECLGHVVEENRRLLPNQDKVKSILEAKRPTTKTQIRSFLGLVGFYRKFIPNFSAVAAPLSDLTKKGCPTRVRWTESQEKAFSALKNCMAKSPVLKLPDFDRPFILQTDASEVGLGAVLLQESEDGKMPIAYASRKLLEREKRYAVIEKECLAIVWGITKFQRYLYGKEFLLETDHQPLKYLQKSKTLNPRIMRWALTLQPYYFRIVAIKGQDNVGADFFSRQ